jgi:hypothetical protein
MRVARVASDNQNIKDMAVHSLQVNEDKNPPAAKSGLYRFLGALLKVRTGSSVIGEVGAITHRQLESELSIFCPVVSWANQSIGALKHCSLDITILIRIRICRLAINISPWKDHK